MYYVLVVLVLVLVPNLGPIFIWSHILSLIKKKYENYTIILLVSMYLNIV